MTRRSGFLAAVLSLCVLVAGGCTLFVAAPVAQFDARPLVIYAGDLVSFDAGASTGDLVDFHWEIQGSVQSGRTVTTAFARPGAYRVRLTVEDGQGRTASAEQDVIVYARSGTRLFVENFADGKAALGRWPLDPAWAVPAESSIELTPGSSGYALYVNSARETYNRRGTELELPPLRVGQRVVFSVRVMALQTQDQHTFVVAPGRATLALPIEGFPYLVYSSTYGGSAIREPAAGGSESAHPVAFAPSVYEWRTLTLSYWAGGYELAVDGSVLRTGTMDADPTAGGSSWLVLGDESLTEACQVYFDDIAVSVEE